MGAGYFMPKAGGFYAKEKLSMEISTSGVLQLSGRRPRWIVASVATGILDLYAGNMTVAQQGIGDYRFTPGSASPVFVPIPHGMSVDQWTVWNASTVERLIACLIFSE